MSNQIETIQVNKKEADLFLKKISDMISILSIFPRLKSEMEALQELEEDAEKLLGKNIPHELQKIIDSL